jgi:hypothetical protein
MNSRHGLLNGRYPLAAIVWSALSLDADCDDFAGLNHSERSECRRNCLLQMFQSIGRTTENQDCDPSIDNVLLMRKALIDCDEDIETSGFGGLKRSPILDTR